MKQKGFTLVELLIVIIIVVLTTILITVKITKNIKDAKELKEKQIISTIESAAYLYATTYQEELSTLNSINVESIPISTLISKGLLNSNSIDDIPSTNLVIIAIIENDIRTKYNKNQTYDNAIFLNGLKEISISKGSTYVDSGAYVAIANTGITLVPQEKITSSVNTNQKGKYKVTYSYDNAENIERIVNVTDGSSN